MRSLNRGLPIRASAIGSRFKDHFSGHAGDYAAHRPSYPAALFDYLASCCEQHDLAWDCATGNGQAARSLAPFFRHVLASDASDSQIAAAEAHPGVEFRVATAEASPLAAATADLVTVAQALHWFDIDRFFDEVKRVLRPGGVLAVWSYERCRVNPDCNTTIEKVFAEVEDYWPAERQIVERHYAGIELPVPEIPAKAFDMQLAWTVAEMVDYMRTWSASRRYLADRGEDPVLLFADELADRWGPGARDVRWPLTLRVGRQQN